ncbi:DUF6483 family protein [Clostridium perfringens]|uniref:DUF6483 family protein n=1 Tax=Clostridium perfringens TaxID=1502 RepID=UPI00224678C0|nr:DUF6483 family protein [Clostridium perfringens]MCX0355979.1 DUF6483 family protein [Clostridium perfringens]MDM0611200.1 DUF6483 family protein [Clostridium perfringens]
MRFEQDYIKRVIDSIGKMCVAMVSGKNAIESNIEDNNYDMKISEDDLLEIMVKKYANEGNINEAENIIFEAIKSHKTKKSYEIALDFYKHINDYSDEKLKELNFSREEIVDGLNEIKHTFR